ncbi:hypothetical protein, partial [Enterobacter hormaechei]|uniref:hypothetical protein n=1 Tax=Enterobacter hormaechei TaxID=158836 RepID=UPI000B0D7A27
MDNAYLFMRGHNINDFFVSILDKTYDLYTQQECQRLGNDSNLLIVFYVQIMPDDFVMQLHR